MGKPIDQSEGEVDFSAAIYEYYADNAEKFLADEPIELLDGRGLGADPPQLGRRAAGHHAVELPVLPGRPVRRAEPDAGQHHPAQARAAVPRVGGGAAADLQRRRLSGGRLRQHLRDQRPGRRHHRRPTRARGFADGLRARGCRRRGDRGPQPEEGRPRTRRLRPVHRAELRRPGRHRGGRHRRPLREHRAGLQRGQADHRLGERLRRLPGQVHQEGARKGRGSGPAVVGRGRRTAGRPGEAGRRRRRHAGVRGRAQGRLLPAGRAHQCLAGLTVLQRGAVRTGGDRLQGRLRGRGRAAGQRHPVRAGLLRLHHRRRTGQARRRSASRRAWCSSMPLARKASSFRSAA